MANDEQNAEEGTQDPGGSQESESGNKALDPKIAAEREERQDEVIAQQSEDRPEQ